MTRPASIGYGGEKSYPDRLLMWPLLSSANPKLAKIRNVPRTRPLLYSLVPSGYLSFLARKYGRFSGFISLAGRTKN